LGLEDGLAVDAEPLAYLEQALLLDLRDASVGGGSHVEHQVPAPGHGIDEQMHERLSRKVVLGALVAVVAERRAEAADLLEHAVLGQGSAEADLAVLGRIDAAVDAAAF